MKQAQRQEREEILPLGHKTRPAREKRTVKGVGGGCDATRSGPTKRRVWARCDEVSIRPKTISLHASRYYRATLALVLNGSKLWVKGLLHSRGGRYSPLGWRLPFKPDGLYSPKRVEGEFCELRLDGVLGTSRVRGSRREVRP